MTEKKLRQQVQLDAKVMHQPYWQGTRITLLLNQAQDWLQQELLKTGSLNWKAEATLTFSPATLQDINVSQADVPSDWLKDMPIEQIYPLSITPVAGVPTRPCREVDIRNFVELVENTYTTPTAQRSIFVMMDTDIFVYPNTIASGEAIYTRKILDLVYDNDSVNTEIPKGMEQALVDRVVTQINIIESGVQLTNAKIADIDKRIAKKYQLEVAKVEKQDREVTQ
jgi:hypothetical protein